MGTACCTRCLALCFSLLNLELLLQRFLLGSRWSQHQPPLPGEHQADKFARLGMERDTEDWDCVFRLGLLWARANSPLRVLEQAVSIVDAVCSYNPVKISAKDLCLTKFADGRM